MKLLSKIALFSVLLVFSYQQVNTFYQFLYYKTHETEIIMEFCVNKDKPELKCNGKCHLAKKVSMENETNVAVKMNSKKKDIPRAKLRIQEDLLFIEDVTAQNEFSESLTAQLAVFYLPVKSEKHHLLLLKPPIS